MEKLNSRSGGDFDRVFRRLDLIVEQIHHHAVEPAFSINVKRRSADTGLPSDVTDEYILKRMISLIAFSQQVKSQLIKKMEESGVFERIFASYSPTDVALLDPEELRETYWDNPSKPQERLAPLRFPSKLYSMVGCANGLLKIASHHGSFMQFIASHQYPNRIDSPDKQKMFWQSFDATRSYLEKIGFPFFGEFTSLCHLLQDIGLDSAKPDSRVMGVAERLGVIGTTTKKGQRPLKERKEVVKIMQMYSAHRGIKTPVVDLYFLIYGGQTEAREFVQPAFYSLSL